jgi:hypothetical protein
MPVLDDFLCCGCLRIEVIPTHSEVLSLFTKIFFAHRSFFRSKGLEKLQGHSERIFRKFLRSKKESEITSGFQFDDRDFETQNLSATSQSL